jgi:hypothetical protein
MNEFKHKITFWQSLAKQQKYGLGFLLLFSLIVLLFWFIQLRQQLIYPFYNNTSPAKFYASQNFNKNIGVSKEESIKAYQQSKDTDNDGLSDWDELNIYHTSPYLDDSDGDNISDYNEVKDKTNPNCPEGSVCSEDNLIINNEKSNNSSNSNSAVINPLNQNQTNTLLKAFGENPSADILRSALIKSGANAEEMNKISDKELLLMYSKMMSEK